MTLRALPWTNSALWPRLPLGFLAAFAAATLMLATAVHISAILLAPRLARADGWSRLDAVAGRSGFAEIPAEGPAGAGLDPLFVNGACRVRLSAAPARIRLEARDLFWSLALYDRQGTIVFSLNDRTAAGGLLDMMVVNARQEEALKAGALPGAEARIMVTAPADDLIAILRLYAPSPRERSEAAASLGRTTCGEGDAAPTASRG